jgi:hypothetical protein
MVSRPSGRKNNKTILIEAEHKAFQQLVLQNLRPLFDAPLVLAKGLSYVSRFNWSARWAR